MIHYEIHVLKKHGLNGIRHVLFDNLFLLSQFWAPGKLATRNKAMTRYDNLII